MSDNEENSKTFSSGGGEEDKGLHLVAWARICTSKKKGGAELGKLQYTKRHCSTNGYRYVRLRAAYENRWWQPSLMKDGIQISQGDIIARAPLESHYAIPTAFQV